MPATQQQFVRFFVELVPRSARAAAGCHRGSTMPHRPAFDRSDAPAMNEEAAVANRASGPGRHSPQDIMSTIEEDRTSFAACGAALDGALEGRASPAGKGASGRSPRPAVSLRR
jgi:hypothetical protein